MDGSLPAAKPRSCYHCNNSRGKLDLKIWSTSLRSRPHFRIQSVGEVAQLLGLRKTRTTPLNPQSDGKVKRFNHIIDQFLFKVVDIEQQN